jgi:hypothetical protein
LLALLTVAPVTVAREVGSTPTPYGRDFVRLTALEVPERVPLQSAPEAESYQRRVEQEQWREGPYGFGLSQALLDSANYFQSRGDFDRAIPLLRRAVHVTRVNDGLYSTMQLPLLEDLLQNYLRQGDVTAANEVQSWLYNVRRQKHQPGDAGYVEATLTYSDWQRKRWLLEPDPESLSKLYDIWALLDKQTPKEDPAALPPALLVSLVYAQIKFLYLVEVSELGLDRQSELMLGRQYSRDAQQPDAAKSQLQFLQKISYSRGKQRLLLLIDQLATGENLLAQADAEAQLGDWHLWHGNRTRAGERYRNAWQLLGSEEVTHYRQIWFGEPVELPPRQALYAGAQAEDLSQSQKSAVAGFTISARGKVRDIDTSGEQAEEDGSAYRLYRLLRNARFRPRLEDGEMVVTAGVLREYQILN